MAQKTVNIAIQETSDEILSLLKVVKTMVTDVSNFDWKTFFQNMSNDEVFSTKFYRFETSTSPQGEKMNASAGLVSNPSTPAAKGRDDFAAHPAFYAMDCNFVCTDDGQRIPTAIVGGNGYKKTGKVDVGVMVPLTYWGIQDFDTYYIVHFSTAKHPEIDCTTVTPWCDEELGYGILTKYYAGQIDGLLYSSSGNPIYNFVSALSGNTELQKKGKGYHGSGSERIAYGLCMLWTKYATKNSQSVFNGCTNYNVQVQVAEAGENVNYVVIPTANTSRLRVGNAVSIGDKGANESTDRGNAYMRDIADKVRVLKIEQISGTSNSRVYVEKEGMTIPETVWLSTMPLHSGTTDDVEGLDGYVDNDGTGAFKIGGIEESVGVCFLSMNELWNKTTASTVDCYARGVAAWSSTAQGWMKVATVDLTDSNDCWQGDVDIDLKTGIVTTKTKGTGSGTGVGDMLYKGGTGTGWREALRVGGLGSGSGGGLCCAGLWGGVSGAGWNCALCI